MIIKIKPKKIKVEPSKKVVNYNVYLGTEDLRENTKAYDEFMKVLKQLEKLSF